MKLRKLVLFRPSGLGELFEFHGARCNAYSMGRTMTAKASEEENAMPDAQVISAAKDIDHLIARFTIAELPQEMHTVDVHRTIARNFGEDDTGWLFHYYGETYRMATDKKDVVNDIICTLLLSGMDLVSTGSGGTDRRA